MKKAINYFLVFSIAMPLIACGGTPNEQGGGGGTKPSTESLLPTDITKCDPLPISDLEQTIDVNLDQEVILNNSLGITYIKTLSCGIDESGELVKDRYDFNLYNDEFLVTNSAVSSDNLNNLVETRVKGNIDGHCYEKYTLWNGCVDYYVGDAVAKDDTIKTQIWREFEWDEEDISGYRKTDNYYYLVTSYSDSYTETTEGVEVLWETTEYKICEFTKDLKLSGFYYYTDTKIDHDYETLQPLPEKQIVYLEKRLSSVTYGEKQDYPYKEEFYNSLPEVANKNALLEVNYRECELEDGAIKTLGEEKNYKLTLLVSRIDGIYSTGTGNLKITASDPTKYIAITGIKAGVQSRTIRGEQPGSQVYSYYDFDDLSYLQQVVIPGSEEMIKDGTNYLVFNGATPIEVKLTFKAFSANAEPELQSK